MRQIEGVVTREKVEVLAREWAEDPSTVVEVIHSGYNADTVSGGFAFRADRGLMLYNFGGGCMYSVDPGYEAARLADIDQWWRETQHGDRPLALDDVNEWHRAAIAALVADLDSVGDLTPTDRPGVTDIARADYIYVCMRRHARERTQVGALEALAANDWIMALDGNGDTAHPCPICGRPAIGRAWEYDTVWGACYSKPVCRGGRQVAGYNTSIGGGFEAAHLDDKSVCDQVTRDGSVWIDGIECHMGEAKFGGVFVGVGP